MDCFIISLCSRGIYSHFFNFAVNLDPRDTVKFKIATFSTLGTPGTPREPLGTPRKLLRQYEIRRFMKERNRYFFTLGGISYFHVGSLVPQDPKEPALDPKEPFFGTLDPERSNSMIWIIHFLVLQFHLLSSKKCLQDFF